MVELKGLHIVRAKGNRYVYAWRGGPRLHAEIGTPAFMAEYTKAIEDRHTPAPGYFRSVITRYRASPDFRNLADTTRRNWARWLDRIDAHFGTLSTRAFDRTDKIRPLIRQWRSGYAETPRAADYGMQVLSRVCSYAVDPLGEIGANPCEGIKQLYAANRAAIIWTPDDLAALRAVAPGQVMRAVDLAAATGLRVSDLIRVSWGHIGPDAIVIATGKSGHRREAVVPLHDELVALLETIPRKSPIVLTNSRGRPWTADGLNSSFAAAVKDAGLKGRDLHFHDLRGTAATRFYLAGLSVRVIAEIMAWEEDHVERIIRRYVDRRAALTATIAQLREARQPVERAEGYEIVATAVAQNAAAMAADGGVYFVRGKTSGRVKIGRARNAIGRLMELSIGSSETLELQAVIVGGANEEAYLHHWFRKQRVKGEWFESDAILDELIAAMSADNALDWKAWLTARNVSNVVRLKQE